MAMNGTVNEFKRRIEELEQQLADSVPQEEHENAMSCSWRTTEDLRRQLAEAQRDREQAIERGVNFVRYCLDRAFQKVTQENKHHAPHPDRRWWREIRAETIEAAKWYKRRAAIDAAMREDDDEATRCPDCGALWGRCCG